MDQVPMTPTIGLKITLVCETVSYVSFFSASLQQFIVVMLSHRWVHICELGWRVLQHGQGLHGIPLIQGLVDQSNGSDTCKYVSLADCFPCLTQKYLGVHQWDCVSYVHAPPAQSGWPGRYRPGCHSRSDSRCLQLWLPPSDASTHPCTCRAQKYSVTSAACHTPFRKHTWQLRHLSDNVSLTPGACYVCAHLCAYSSATLLRPVTELDSCFQRAALSPTSIASFISTTEDSISTATSSSGWDKVPCRTEATNLAHMSNCQRKLPQANVQAYI